MSEDNNEKTTRASINIVPTSMGDKNREIMSSLNFLISPKTTKMTNKVVNKEAIEEPSIFINK